MPRPPSDYFMSAAIEKEKSESGSEEQETSQSIDYSNLSECKVSKIASESDSADELDYNKFNLNDYFGYQ